MLPSYQYQSSSYPYTLNQPCSYPSYTKTTSRYTRHDVSHLVAGGAEIVVVAHEALVPPTSEAILLTGVARDALVTRHAKHCEDFIYRSRARTDGG